MTIRMMINHVSYKVRKCTFRHVCPGKTLGIYLSNQSLQGTLYMSVAGHGDRKDKYLFLQGNRKDLSS